MADNACSFNISNQPPLIQLVVALFVISVVGLLLSLLFMLIAIPVFHITPGELLQFPGINSGPHEKIILKYIQVSQQVALFLIPSLIISWMLKSDGADFLKRDKAPPLFTLLVVIILAVLIIPFITYTGYLNSWLDLPDRFSVLEDWIRTKEDDARQMTSLMIESPDLLTFSINIFVMAVIPAVSEEFLFRGVLQQLFGRVLRSPLAGLWISAILFSAIHFQFYGFMPRLILGLVFGYLFYLTSNIWLSVAAHFTNNGLLVIFSRMKELKTEGTDIISKEITLADFPFISVILSCLIFWFLWNEFRRRSKTGSNQ